MPSERIRRANAHRTLVSSSTTKIVGVGSSMLALLLLTLGASHFPSHRILERVMHFVRRQSIVNKAFTTL
jgi:hypothetical protein